MQPSVHRQLTFDDIADFVQQLAPAAPATCVLTNFLCSSSDDDMTVGEVKLKFAKGCTTHGNAVEFTRAFSRHVRACRMADCNLTKQVYACAAVCDEVTEHTIEQQIATGEFTHATAGRRRFDRGGGNGS